jgi:hypothetical protein
MADATELPGLINLFAKTHLTGSVPSDPYSDLVNLVVGNPIESIGVGEPSLHFAVQQFQGQRPHIENDILFASSHHGMRLRHHRGSLTSSHIQEAIRSSRRILELRDNWDDEGTPVYEEQTWTRATKFVQQTAFEYWKQQQVWVTAPRILPGPEGGIDIHWKTSKRELLINIPADNEAPAGYYGTGGPKDNIKGKLDTSSKNEWILVWLLR